MSITVTPALHESVKAALGADLLSSTEEHGQLIVTITADRIVPVLTRLRDDPALLLEQLIDVCGVDYPDRVQRFEVVYSLLSGNRSLAAAIDARHLSLPIYLPHLWYDFRKWRAHAGRTTCVQRCPGC